MIKRPQIGSPGITPGTPLSGGPESRSAFAVRLVRNEVFLRRRTTDVSERWIRFILILTLAVSLRLDAQVITENNPLAMPAVGSSGLLILSRTVLELTLITTKEPDPAGVEEWNFSRADGQPAPPAAGEFEVRVNGTPSAVARVGFKRRVLYAPLKQRDLRIENHLYLEMAAEIPDGAQVEVRNPGGALWDGSKRFEAAATPSRWNPAIHVNGVGYLPALTKKAMVGFYLGSLGELKLNAGTFQILEAGTGAVAFEGALKKRLDRGFTYSPAPYQQVWEADFTALQQPGVYRLAVPGLGVSHSFRIDEGSAAAMARTYALGLYHQRCGTANEWPFTRCPHAACHTAPAEVPTDAFAKTREFLAEVSSDYRNEPRHTAPQLKDVGSSLYPFKRAGQVNVTGGHHDAGDYSKYTINSAALLHYLVFAADAFPGAGELDNLGLPESGDGKSDLLQEAKWEADFLLRMQDDDGGFYFLVYPKERRYEDNVLPDKGDSQVVWPKNTAVTAAAVAALAEAGSSKRMREQFPAHAAAYVRAAEFGWAFLDNAIFDYGKDGSYQKLTHYGYEFLHDDELAWAAAALYAATGKEAYQAQLKEWFNPSATATKRWGWWRLYEGYGCAARTYAFAARTGRLEASQLDPVFLAACEKEIVAAANDQWRFARDSAYGTSFPERNKKDRSAGWYFSAERAFDLAVAHQIEPRAEWLEALIGNLNYEAGCNPLNLSYVTGLGWRRQRDVVHHYAQNDRRALPPSGLPIGNIQSGFAYHFHYKQELGALSLPADGAGSAPYPFYDRWGDSFNTTTEFVVVDQARSLGTAVFLMGQTELKDQPWTSGAVRIGGVPGDAMDGESVVLRLEDAPFKLSDATIVWEARDQDPAFGETFSFVPVHPGEQWVEVEVQMPDGRRLFASTNFSASISADTPPNAFQSAPVELSDDVAGLFHLDENVSDSSGNWEDLHLSGVELDTSNVGWMRDREGRALRVSDLGSGAAATVPRETMFGSGETAAIQIEAMIYVHELKAYNRGKARLLSLEENWNAYLELIEDPYTGLQVKGGTQLGFSGPALQAALSPKQWHHVSLSLDHAGYTVRVDGEILHTKPSHDLANWGHAAKVSVTFGNMDGWVDEVVVRRRVGLPPEKAPDAIPVSTPFITPAGGTFHSPVPVSMATSTPGAVIRYTTDGSNPTTQSPVYAGPFTVAESSVVKARAFVEPEGESGLAGATIAIPPAGSASSPAVFVGVDSAGQGNWRGVIGKAGFAVPAHASELASPVQFTSNGAAEFVWVETTSDARALQRRTGETRLASCWFDPSSVDLNVQVAESHTAQVALYFLDWDRAGREQRVQVFDAENGTLIDERLLTHFSEGRHLIWAVRGRVRFHIERIAGPNAVVSGAFIDAVTVDAEGGSGGGAVPSGRIEPVGPNERGEFRLRIHGVAGRTYRVEGTGNMREWTVLGQAVLAGSSAEFVDPAFNQAPMRFYRATQVELHAGP